jgi:hypothetical protein
MTVPVRPGAGEDPIWQLWRELPAPWRREVIGPGIPGWEDRHHRYDEHKLKLAGLPDPIAAELAWMAYWQETIDGTPASVQTINQLVLVLRLAQRHNHPFPGSIRQMDAATADRLLCWFYATRWRRLPPPNTRSRLNALFRFARLALIVRCHYGPWWELDDWHPRSDPRIPLTTREPRARMGISPGRVTLPWLRVAVKWHLGTRMEAGTLRWSTVGQSRLLVRLDRWLTSTFDDPRDVIGDPADAAAQAAAFRRWASDPVNRSTQPQHHYLRDRTTVQPRLINDDLRAVAELFAFLAANPADTRAILGEASPATRATDVHADAWARQLTRLPHKPMLNTEHYIDDRALAQITAALPLLALPRDEQMPITRGDGTQVLANGFGDPQAMRMILLQILTGRRESEIRTCEFDCLSALPTPPAGADGEQVMRFRYAQSKIDIAPDTILVDREVAAIIIEQQRWVREQHPTIEPRFLFVQRICNIAGAKSYSPGTYRRWLRQLSDIVQITDSAGRQVRLSHTHRFRHTRFTRLAELGLPIHVLQRYAGHATPMMSMHYVAQREEHAEQAFLATAKLKADGTQMVFSRDDHDTLHLFDRADRLLPHGWCLLPPLQSCDKGNACLTCSVFVTDETHQTTLQRQLDDTEQLIAQTTSAFEQRHGHPMPDENVWLTQRHAERDALTRLLATMRDNTGRAVQGAGCRTGPDGPVPLTLDLTRHRRTRP